jgi:hypothetical protein
MNYLKSEAIGKILAKGFIIYNNTLGLAEVYKVNP